ncbi:hypothetical protein QYE76_047490 [Lolium multiflorum]|uniref:CCHC-type domain-containing protein n=1 Tax=Lolium multiflorum TaxID=4521 RepID=A0AAD8WZC8_LOLMU|nr:hypothetical protein QYE76_047490 [Lolium multiflorum]
MGSGDAEAEDPATPAPRCSPSALCSRPSVSGGGFGGRFWALTPDVDDAEATSEPSEEGSPVRAPGRGAGTPFGVFLRAAEELGGSLRSGRRAAFAPGGRGSRFAATSRGGAAVGDRPRWKQRWPSARGREASGDRGVRRRAPAPPSASSAPAGGATRPDVACSPRSAPEAAADERGRPPLDPLGFPPLHSRPVDGPLLGPAQVSAVGLQVGASAAAHVPGAEHRSDGAHLQSISAVVREPLSARWCWIRKGASTLELGFPASVSDVRRHRKSARRVCVPPPPSPLRLSFAAVVAMERPQGEGGQRGRNQSGNKRRHDERAGSGSGTGGGRTNPQQQEADLRARALAEKNRNRSGTEGARAGGQGGNSNHTPPAWWVEREKKRAAKEAARLAQVASGAAAPPPPSASGGGRAHEAAAGKKATEPGRSTASSGSRPASGVAEAAVPSTNMECFKCGRMGHFQAACTFPPVCLLCGVEGHNSAACTSKGRQPELRVMGQAVAGESFFALEFEEDDEESEEMSNGAVISFKHVVLSVSDLTRELHHLVEADWDWQVEETSAHEFSVVFPSRESLQISARSGRLFLPLSGTVADIRLADSDLAPVEMLQEVWIRLTGVPRRMRRADRLLAGMRMLGWPVRVDEDSIRRRQPVRMLLACRNPDKLRGSVQLFHKKLGYNIGVHVEPASGASTSAPPPPPQAGPEDDEDEDDDDVDDLSPSRKEWDELGARDQARAAASGAPSAAPPVDAPVDAAATPATPATEGLAPAASAACAPVDLGGSTAAPGPVEPVVSDQYGSNLRGWPLPLLQLEQARAADLASAGCRPSLILEDGEAPTSPLLPDSSTLLTAESDGEDSADSPSKNTDGVEAMDAEVAGGDDEMLEEGGQVVDQGAPAAGRQVIPRRRRTKTVPAELARKSARLTDSTPVMQRAQERAAAKNLEPGTISDFAVLPSLSDSHLVSVTHDCGMAFETESRPVAESISLIRANEEAQAVLALAVFRKEVEVARKATSSSAPGPVATGAAPVSGGDGDPSLVEVPVLAATRANTGGIPRACLASRSGRRKAPRI